MRLRVWSVLSVVVVLLISSPGGHAGAITGPVNSTTAMSRMAPGDNDDDGLGDEVDPDDDNDQVMDNADPAPFDPSIPAADVVTTPDPVGQDEDTDGDGITNNADPDDNNDGVPDAPVPVVTEVPAVAPTPAPATVPPTLEPTGVPVAEQPTATIAATEPVAVAPQEPVAEVPVVTALPSTGTGSSLGITPALTTLAGVIALILAAAGCNRVRSYS